MILKGTAYVPGSCGELVQGTLDGINFHITCPVNRYSKVTISLDPSLKKLFFPSTRPKTARAVRKMLDILGYPTLGGIIEISSSLPIGKGMASSTADITAACYAVASILQVKVELNKIAQIALSLEPSDGTFLSGIYLFDHVKGQICEHLGEPFPLGIIALDFGGIIDTIEFNQRSDLFYYNHINEPQIKKALEMVKSGLIQKDPYLLGKGTTLSALVNQKIILRPYLDKLIDFVTVRGAYGVNIAHSGTVVGILVPPGEEKNYNICQEILKYFPKVKKIYPLRLTPGGPRYLGKVKKEGKILWGNIGMVAISCKQQQDTV